MKYPKDRNCGLGRKNLAQRNQNITTLAVTRNRSSLEQAYKSSGPCDPYGLPIEFQTLSVSFLSRGACRR